MNENLIREKEKKTFKNMKQIFTLTYNQRYVN